MKETKTQLHAGWHWDEDDLEESRLRICKKCNFMFVGNVTRTKCKNCASKEPEEREGIIRIC